MTRNSLTVAAILVASAGAASAQQIYSWRDDYGRTQYGDSCPADTDCRQQQTLKRESSCPSLRSWLRTGSPALHGKKKDKTPAIEPAPAPTPAPTEPTPVEPTPVEPTPTPTGGPVQVLWSAGIESGSLSEFEGENNSGSADSVAVLAANEGIAARKDSWVVKQSVFSSGGTRLYRNSAINNVYRTGNPIYYSFWAYFPQATHLSSGGFFNLLQIQSINPGGNLDPVWILGLHPSSFTLRMEWWSNLQMSGPHAGESGGRAYDQAVPIPLGQWVFMQVMVTPREDYSGAVKVWMNDRVVFDITNVRTKYAESNVSGGTQSFYISKNAYGQNMTPTPNHHYVDEVAISLDPMPYVP